MTNNTFYYIALVGIFASSISLFGILVTLPMIVRKANNLRYDVDDMSFRFKEEFDNVWKQMQAVMSVGDYKDTIIMFSRAKRSPWAKHICRGCHSLACPSGQAGSAGSPGKDGLPGDAGPAGVDGLDVELQPQADLPCVICPAGPPGQRGNQGERGLAGLVGTRGDKGPDGSVGKDGPPGNPGPLGKPGPKGKLGFEGPPGDTTIAGIGIKGPQGPSGPAGAKGRPGVPGKASRELGTPGKNGPPGPIGPIGNYGTSGRTGSAGPPGEPGQPAAYCPSDCGVSQIVAPSQVHPTKKENADTSQYGADTTEKPPSEYLWALRR